MSKIMDESPKRYTRSILALVVVIGLISTVGLIRDLSKQGIRPFGFIENVLAQVTQSNALSSVFVSQNEEPVLRKVFDSTDRCRPSGVNPLIPGKGGINLAALDSNTWRSVIDYSHGKNDVNEQLNMGYQLGMFTDPNDSGSAAEFIIDTSKAGMIPIVRLCYPGGCNFQIDVPLLRNPDNVQEMAAAEFQSQFATHDIVDFYKAIINELDRRIGGNKVYNEDISNLQGYEFVALVGPNEPGTAGEMQAFGIDNYDTLVRSVNEAGYYLQKLRVANGGIMYLAPGAFNLSNTQGDDLKEFFGPIERNNGGVQTTTQNGTELKVEYFDYVLGNAYDQDSTDPSHEPTTAATYVTNGNGGSGINLNYVSRKYDLPIILTEFGTFNGNMATFKYSFKQLCLNDNVEGILFFRNIAELQELSPEPRPLQVSTEVIRDMTLGCSRKITFPNCNFDTTLYATTRSLADTVPDSLAKAESFCSVVDEDYETKAAVTGGSGYRVVCGDAGNGRTHCSANAQNTLQIGLPINSFGSNSAFGTRTRQFPSYNVEAYASQSNQAVDSLNQFAGKITVGGITYPMPWLGSAIQNSSEIIMDNIHQGDVVGETLVSPGLEVYSSIADIAGDSGKGLARSVPYSTSGISKDGKIPDERTVLANDIVFDKALLSDLQALRPYNPSTFNSASEFPTYPMSCNSTGRYVSNADDYIYGPEIQLQNKAVWDGSGGRMCALVANRYGSSSPRVESLDPLNCQVLEDQFYISPSFGAISCRAALPACAQSADGINGGFCYIEPDVADQCLNFVPPDTGFRGVRVYVYSNTLDDIDAKVEIPGIYDSIFRLKDLMNREFKTNDLKLVMQEGYGWEVEVKLTTRDTSDIANQVVHQYVTTDAEKDVSNFEGEKVNMSSPNYVVRQFMPAKELSQKTNKSYIKDLEYLNQINEIRSVYLSDPNSSHPNNLSEYFSGVTNPFYDPSDTSKPNFNRQNILISDMSSQAMSYPLLSCDQVNICKKFSQSELIAQGYDPRLAANLCPLPGTSKINPAAKVSCITDIVDNRVEDVLDTELCRRGYQISDKCKLQCIAAPVDSSPTTPPASEGESTIRSLADVTPGLASLTNRIETTMQLPEGMLIALMEREITSAVKTVQGEPFEQLYRRSSSGQYVWGPAQFHHISWYGSEYAPFNDEGRFGTGYGELDGRGFGGNSPPYIAGTQQCLDALAINYTDGQHLEEGKADVLERSYLGFALCAAAAKLKNDSRTFDKQVTEWTQDDVFNASRAYLGDCSQFGRKYCDIYVETICNTYPEKNPIICEGVPIRPSPGGEICVPIEVDPTDGCNYADISLKYPMPSVQLVVSQKYGSNLHSGVDLAAAINTPIVAAADGVVTSINNSAQQPANGAPQDPSSPGYSQGAGNFVKIKHLQFQTDNEIWTSYQHMSRVESGIVPGVQVKAGQVIGYVGTTGRTTGPHLHFELRLNDCYDGYGEGDNPLGTCSADPQLYMYQGDNPLQCIPGAGTDSDIMTGSFSCPVTSPTRISQNSDGCNAFGTCGFSHSKDNIYNQYQQKPTDITAPGQQVVAPTDGTIIEIRDPVETVNAYQPIGSICGFIKLPDQSESYYDGGFVIHMLDSTGRLWRFVHVEGLKVNEGDKVTKGQQLAEVYDGKLGVETNYSKNTKYGDKNWEPWSVRSDNADGCFNVNNAHLHFAIISKDAISAPYFEGNEIDSTPWVKKFCSL